MACVFSSPLDQFELTDLISLDAPLLDELNVSLSNLGLYLSITTLIALSVNFLTTSYKTVIANS